MIYYWFVELQHHDYTDRYLLKILTQEWKENFGINQTDRFQTSGTGNLLNLTKVHITNQGNGIMNMNIERAVLQYYDDLDSVTSDKSSCSGELEAESHNDSVPHDSDS